ncbi:hypothetical protein [Candidatus Regiella insecticola]|uniref:hypothetical protein n=1 Tax=Candidatus Regiella insecticola TaxID=138073 RepID=UPI0002F24A4D|nr:hypothetical protein [Candidatus Regiella insecticola]
MNFELRQGGKGNRPMSVDRLRDSASTRRQQSRNLKGEGYTALAERKYIRGSLTFSYKKWIFYRLTARVAKKVGMNLSTTKRGLGCLSS